MNKISGVYQIVNLVTGECYIGSSRNIERRWRDHRSLSRWKQCPNNALYKDFKEYGLESFLFKVIEETDNLCEREQYWIRLLKPSYNSNNAKGLDTERYKEYQKRYMKEYQQTVKYKEYQKRYNKKYYSQFCLYKDETLTLGTLIYIFRKQGIPHPTKEAKKYLVSDTTNYGIG